ncbi:hypothetical protein AKJ29_12180 [Aliiroseovarius crassostreae]|uniref:Uncharacterized protein n=1 Tax=Aliiroseovarius crassostreae TaxID=154981 RepID=A0A0P7KMR7_9RHOB|nr:hypothetical protein AKJ29_12180 [Aliiroseovarius crassostreae]
MDLDEFNGTYRAWGNTTTTAIAGIKIKLWLGGSTQLQLETNGALIAMILTGATHHAIHRHAGLRRADPPGKCTIRAQCCRFTGVDAGIAEGAGPAREIQRRQPLFVSQDDPLGTGARAITALGAAVMKGDFTRGPRRALVLDLVDLASQKGAS